jgi:hypothetical protein
MGKIFPSHTLQELCYRTGYKGRRFVMKMGQYLCEQARTFSVDGFAKHHRVKMKWSAVPVSCGLGIYRE